MNKPTNKQKNNSKKLLIQKLEKDLEDLRIKNEKQIKIFETKKLILEHLIKNAYLYGTLNTKNYFGYEVKNCDWCKTSFVDNSRTKNQRFCRTSCRVASWRIDNGNDKGGKKLQEKQR
tara:strand:- start:494 stop:847 length:354 start_codon:yes stop_codon:yes gene_type:complete